jgi:hypothetical protein
MTHVIVSAQKPVVTGKVISDYAPAPTTLSNLISSAKIIVYARVDDTKNAALAHSGRRQPMTEYYVRVLDVIKGDVTQGQLLTILRSGGSVDEGDHIVQSIDPSFGPFREKENYVLFLNWNVSLARFEVVYGPNGAFHVAGSTIEPMGNSSFSTSSRGRPANDFISDTKKLSRN